ncbi:hypothetical protein D9M73_156470 [compost metagenome]
MQAAEGEVGRLAQQQGKADAGSGTCQRPAGGVSVGEQQADGDHEAGQGVAEQENLAEAFDQAEQCVAVCLGHCAGAGRLRQFKNGPAQQHKRRCVGGQAMGFLAALEPLVHQDAAQAAGGDDQWRQDG